MKLENLTISKIASGIKAKEFSCREITSLYLQNIKKLDNDIHAYLEVFEERAIEDAGVVDEKIANGELVSAIAGAPLAVKDNILIQGARATAGSKILEKYVASYDATVIKKLKDFGSVFLGKTNLDEFAMGSSTENSAYGATRNPHDFSRVPGGSSGGSAAAVAGNLALAALGSDTGGSIRQPASFSGVVGLKPTYGSVSRFGLIAMASSLDQIGPITKSVEDAAMIFQAIQGQDKYDATTVDTTETEFKKDISPKGLKIGIPKEYFGEGLDADVAHIIRKAIDVFSKQGAEVEEISLPHASFALSTYYIVMPAEVSANLARFDGIRYGYSAKSDTLLGVYEKSRKEGFGQEVKRRIMLGTYALSAGYYEAYYGKAQKVRRLIQEDFKNAFRKVDIILGPTSPTPAFKIGEKTENPLEMYLADVYTVAINLAGVPAISIPCGKVLKSGRELPVGLQLIGKWFDEGRLLSVAYLHESSNK